MPEPCEEAKKLAEEITYYIVKGIALAIKFKRMHDWSGMDKSLAQKIQDVIDKKEKEQQHD